MRFLSLAILGVSLTAFADESVLELDGLIISASRSPVARNQSGSAITVIDRTQLERRQSTFLIDVLREVPGLAVSRSGSLGSATQIRIRGSEANHVLVLVDGVEINDPSLADAVDFTHLSAQNIERIEVVRGPQSALWGSDAVAGVINVITTRASNPFRFQGFAEAGSFSTIHASAGLSALSDDYAYSGSVSYLDTDGTNISRNGNEDDAYENLTANFKTEFDLTEYWSVDAAIRHTNATTQFDPIDFSTTGLPVDGDRETEIKQTYARLGAQLEAGRWTHGLRLTVLDTDNQNFADAVSNTRQAAERLGLSYQAKMTLANQSLVFAIDYEEDDFTQRGSASPFGDPNQDQTTSTIGLVAEYRFQMSEALNWSVSLRYDDNSDFDSILTYRGSGSYAFSNATRLRASIGTGQKRPTFTELFGFFPDQFFGNPNLDPERSLGWEVGIEQSLGAFTVELGYFNEQLRDEINGFVFDPNTFLFTAQNQDGTSHREGIELAIAGELTDWFSLSGSYTYTDSDEPGATGSVRELRRPRNILSVNLNFLPSTRSNVNLNITHNGEQQDLFFPPFPTPSQHVDLDSFTLVNLTGHLDITEAFRLVARVENLLDEEYEEVFGFRSPGIGVYTGVQYRTR